MAASYIYWISTALLSLLYVSSALLYAIKGAYVRSAQAELGFSASYLVPFMVVIKLLAPLVILSRINVGLSDLAYAGILYHLLLSGLAHLGVGKPKDAFPAALGLVLLVASFATQNLARDTPSPYAPATATVAGALPASGYYAAFVLDPDGHNIEAVFHDASRR